MTFHVVIPARYDSTRLPGKPLVDIAGVPMVVRVAEAAGSSGARKVVVATDDSRIVEAVEAAGHSAMLTRRDHASGSDRVMEVAEKFGWSDDAVVLNVQGDEPLIPPAVITQLALCLERNRELASATLCEPIHRQEDCHNPNVVKVVRAVDGRALYFSRAPIPYTRDREAAVECESFRHIGVYAYRLWALRKFVALPRGKLEAVESLEQLRLLENGLTMQVEISTEPVPGGVDTPEDLQRIRSVLSDD